MSRRMQLFRCISRCTRNHDLQPEHHCEFKSWSSCESRVSFFCFFKQNRKIEVEKIWDERV